MLSLIGTILGLLGSLAPEIIKYFKLKADHKHELDVLRVQADMAKAGHQYRMEEVNVRGDIESEQAVYRAAEIKLTGNKILDGLLAFYNGTVRPTIAYAYFAMYAAVKFAMYKLYVANGISSHQAIVTLWNDMDMAVFSTVIAFYYGGRFMKYALNHFGTSVPQILDGITDNGKPSKPVVVPVVEGPKPKKKPKPGEIFDVSPTIDTTGL